MYIYICIYIYIYIYSCLCYVIFGRNPNTHELRDNPMDSQPREGGLKSVATEFLGGFLRTSCLMALKVWPNEEGAQCPS